MKLAKNVELICQKELNFQRNRETVKEELTDNCMRHCITVTVTG